MAKPNPRNTPAGKILTKFETEVLDVHHRTLPLWSRPTAVAFWNMLLAFDLTDIARSQAALGGEPSVGLMQHVKWLDDGLMVAMRFLWNANHETDVIPMHNETTAEEADEFLNHSVDFAILSDFHSGFGNDLYTLEVDEMERRIRFLHSSREGSLPEPHGFMEDSDLVHGRFERGMGRMDDMRHASKILHKVKSHVESGRVVMDDISCLKDDRLDDLLKTQIPEMAFPLESEIPLGPFTLREFQRFWLAVFKWSVVASRISFEATLENQLNRLESVSTQFVDRDLFIARIAGISDLSTQCVTDCLEILTFGAGTTKPDIFLQPFLCSGSNIAWSPHLIQLASPQRNLLKLMARDSRFKSISDNVIGEREKQIGRELGQLLASRGFQFKMNVALPDSLGEIDLLAIRNDCPEQLLMFEVKAVLDVDEINEVDHATKEQLRAQIQLQKAIEILKQMSDEQKLGLWRQPCWGKIKEFYAIVVTPNSQPSSKYDHRSIPAMTFVTWKTKLRPRDYKSPKRLFDACRQKEWLRGFAGGRRIFTPIPIGSVLYEIPGFASEDDDGEVSASVIQ